MMYDPREVEKWVSYGMDTDEAIEQSFQKTMRLVDQYERFGNRDNNNIQKSNTNNRRSRDK